jgi:hypothetical protein
VSATSLVLNCRDCRTTMPDIEMAQRPAAHFRPPSAQFDQAGGRLPQTRFRNLRAYARQDRSFSLSPDDFRRCCPCAPNGCVSSVFFLFFLERRWSRHPSLFA